MPCCAGYMGFKCEGCPFYDDPEEDEEEDD